VAFLLLGTVTGCAADRSGRDVLWQTVSNCLDATSFDYCGTCSVARTDHRCPAADDCGRTLELWTESSHYVSFRDRKMCECPHGFIHGLAVPRAQVTGVEDPRRPSGIWSFAWSAARTRIADDKEIALYVNPRHARSQDQLHVHLVRLRADARQRLAPLTTTRVTSLDGVWSAAAARAEVLKLEDYGVLVATHPEGGFLVLVDLDSPRGFTESTCH